MKNNTKSIIRPITVVTKQVRHELGFPFIDVHSNFSCELGFRDFGQQARISKLESNKDFMYRFMGYHSGVLNGKLAVDKKLTKAEHLEFIEKVGTVADDKLFELRSVTIADDRSVSAQVVWTPGMNEVGRTLLQGDQPEFYFSPILIACHGTKFTSMIVGFDVLRK